jgi:hypothetical protein
MSPSAVIHRLDAGTVQTDPAPTLSTCAANGNRPDRHGCDWRAKSGKKIYAARLGSTLVTWLLRESLLDQVDLLVLPVVPAAASACSPATAASYRRGW